MEMAKCTILTVISMDKMARGNKSCVPEIGLTIPTETTWTLDQQTTSKMDVVFRPPWQNFVWTRGGHILYTYFIWYAIEKNYMRRHKTPTSNKTTRSWIYNSGDNWQIHDLLPRGKTKEGEAWWWYNYNRKWYMGQFTRMDKITHDEFFPTNIMETHSYSNKIRFMCCSYGRIIRPNYRSGYRVLGNQRSNESRPCKRSG